eukprot:jgi/Ulvmu1/5012/UM021_0029.1
MRAPLSSRDGRTIGQLQTRQKIHTYPRSNSLRYLHSFRCIVAITRVSKRPCGLSVCSARASDLVGFSVYMPLLSLILPGIALADDVVAYNAGSQSDFLQNLAGVVYVGLVAYLLYKVFTRRAKRFTSEKLTSAEDEQQAEDPELAEPVTVKPLDAFIGAAQALGIASGLYFFATKMDGVLLSSPLPEQYTVRNMAVTVRTVLRGLVYLATFIFAANGVGLSALGLKLLIFGDEEDAPASDSTPIPKDIPKVGLNSNLDDVMRAFDEASDATRFQKKQNESK